MNIKLLTNIIEQSRDSKFRLIFEKSIFTFFTVSQRSVNTRVRTHAGRVLAIHFTAVLWMLEINPI